MKGKKELKAEHLYKSYLKQIIYPMLSTKTTYLDQLNGVGKKLFTVKFRGTYPSDKIPRLNDLSPYCILNLDKSGEPGSHWVALCKIPKKNECVFYDSFGRSHSKIMKNLKMSGNGRIVSDTKDKEQKMNEVDCGARCMAFIMVFERHGQKMAKLI